MADEVLLEVEERIATVTLNRPKARNALSVALLRLLPELVGEAESRDDVDVIILTGADPAFCAGLDLKELGSDGGALRGMIADRPDRGAGLGPSLPPTTKPLIGAVNGVAVTGGLELALHCDFLVASHHARFADTHARMGVQPLWGLSVLLPQAIGVRRAREMSATGNFIDAPTALAWGLVNHVVPHRELLAQTRLLATDIVSNDRRALATLFETYDACALLPAGEALAYELRAGIEWQRAMVDTAGLERRRSEVTQRGRDQA